MQLINGLISAPQETQKKYESVLQLHLKTLLTLLNKTSLQNTSRLQLKTHKCILRCYKKPESESYDLETLRECKENCNKQLQKVREYLDDINFYSEKKLKGCSKKCYKKSEEAKNQCLWECYNRLDRRYKKYWVEQRQNVEQKFIE